jgi:peptidyl-prolyl cis-trans isomerase A (cyclophilin A)
MSFPPDRRRLLRLLPALAALMLASGTMAQGAGKAAKSGAAPRVLLVTSEGRITLELDADGTVFHRVIDGFMIQGGGFTPDMKQKATRAPIPLESQNGLKNTRGTVAMARTSDPNSATSQFFINVVDNPRLDHPSPDGHGYAVFGRVVEGMEVVDKIRAAATGSVGPFGNVPTQPIVIQSAKLL